MSIGGRLRLGPGGERGATTKWAILSPDPTNSLVEPKLAPPRPSADVHGAYKSADVDRLYKGARAAEQSSARRYRRFALALIPSDAFCLLVSLPLLRLSEGRGAFALGDVPAVAIALLAWIGAFHAFGLYSVRQLSAHEHFRRLIGATAVGILLVTLVWSSETGSFSSASLGAMWLVALLSECATRWLWRRHVISLERSRQLSLRTLIVGTNDEAGRIARDLQTCAGEFSPIGYITCNHYGGANGLPVFGDVQDLAETIRRHSVECLFVASSDLTSSDMLQVFAVAREDHVDVKISANIPEILASRVSVVPVGRMISLHLRSTRLSRTQSILKRMLDLSIATPALLVCLPLMAFIAIAIRLDSPGRIIFRQPRVTRGNRTFSILKFRTMTDRVSSDRDRPVPDLTTPFFKLIDDPRLTRVGRFLRRFSLDELPQLWNVVRGDMSLVGPRPLPFEQVSANDDLRSRHVVPAGITGWWQINGRSRLDAQASLQMDLFYIENWSLTLDLYILLRTAGTVLSGRGAY